MRSQLQPLHSREMHLTVNPVQPFAALVCTLLNHTDGKAPWVGMCSSRVVSTILRLVKVFYVSNFQVMW